LLCSLTIVSFSDIDGSQTECAAFADAGVGSKTEYCRESTGYTAEPFT
jgi:hypothetical protein